MWIETLEPNEVFVFGSNAGGLHGGGAARLAYDKFGAVWGQGHGLQGQSYAVDSMSGLGELAAEAGRFVEFAASRPDLRFLMTEVGCGIAGYAPAEVAPMFAGAGENVVLPESFRAVLER